jgi:transcriptional regulatory protein LevR
MQNKKQLTVRLPQSTVNYLNARAESENKSLNDILQDVTEEYMKWHEGEKVLQDIAFIREKVKEETGVHPDSTLEIRKLREDER